MKRNTPNKRSESEMVQLFRNAYTPKKFEKQKINPIFLRPPYSACAEKEVSMKRMIGKRYKALEDIKYDIEKYSDKKVSCIIESQTDDVEGADNMIDYSFDNLDVNTLFYLKDNAENYYITEV